MIKEHLKIATLFGLTLLSACDSSQTWHCVTQGKNMFSMNESGEIASADKGCSCQEIRSFELRTGSVDEAALANDFGC